MNDEMFNNIPHFIKNHLCGNCLQGDFVMYNYRVPIFKQEVFRTIPDSMIPVDLFQKNQFMIKFTTDDMIFQFELFTNKNG